MKLYTRTVCPKCMWVKSEADRSGVEVEVINIDHDEAARERLMEAGIRGVPVLEVDGRYVVEPSEMLKFMEQVSV